MQPETFGAILLIAHARPARARITPGIPQLSRGLALGVNGLGISSVSIDDVSAWVRKFADHIRQSGLGCRQAADARRGPSICRVN